MELKKNKQLSSNLTPGLTDEEIERMMKDAEANAEADAKRKEEVELRNEVDQAIFATEKQLKKQKVKALIQNVMLPNQHLMSLRKLKNQVILMT